MGTTKKILSLFFSSLILLNSCEVYQGNYSLQNSAQEAKKVKVKTKTTDYLLYNSYPYKSLKDSDLDIWAIVKKNDSTTNNNNQKTFDSIVLMNKIYYGTDNLSNRNSWVKINDTDIEEVSITQKLYLEKIVSQKGKYYGVKDSMGINIMVPIKENQVIKISEYSQGLSILGTIALVPVVAFILLVYLAAVAETESY